jgi:hypothetical protein
MDSGCSAAAVRYESFYDIASRKSLTAFLGSPALASDSVPLYTLFQFIGVPHRTDNRLNYQIPESRDWIEPTIWVATDMDDRDQLVLDPQLSSTVADRLTCRYIHLKGT